MYTTVVTSSRPLSSTAQTTLCWLTLLLLSSNLSASDTARSSFSKWWPGFQKAIAQHKATEVAHAAHFPMHWENGPVREIQTEAELVNRFDVYFTDEIRKRIASVKPERLPNGIYTLTWKARGNEYSLYFKPAGLDKFALDGLSEGAP